MGLDNCNFYSPSLSTYTPTIDKQLLSTYDPYQFIAQSCALVNIAYNLLSAQGLNTSSARAKHFCASSNSLSSNWVKDPATRSTAKAVGAPTPVYRR